MIRSMFVVAILILLIPASVDAGSWAINADYVDACSCKPACPCLFGSPATLGYCEGATLVDIKQGHFEEVDLSGVKVLAVYRGGQWIKFLVSKNATQAQTKAAAKLLPAAEGFFKAKEVLAVENVDIQVTRTEERLKINAGGTRVEIVPIKSSDGKPIKMENMPAHGFPAPAYLDFTQYKTVSLVHESEDKNFSYSDTNAFTARIQVKSEN